MMDPLLLVLIVLLLLIFLSGGAWRSRDLGTPWGFVMAVIIIVLVLRLLGYL